MYHYVNYYPDPNGVVMNITTNAQLIDENGGDTTDTDIKTGLTRVQAQIGNETNNVDGKFAITFNTNINLDTNTANAAMIHTALQRH